MTHFPRQWLTTVAHGVIAKMARGIRRFYREHPDIEVRILMYPNTMPVPKAVSVQSSGQERHERRHPHLGDCQD